MRVYSLYDRVMGEHQAPVLVPNDDVAVRALQESRALNKVSQSVLFRPQDYDLYCLGEFDVESGKLAGFDRNELVANLADIFKGVPDA